MASRTAGAGTPPVILPWLLGAPIVVVAGLLLWKNVFAVFAIYHLGICLLLPAAHNLLGRRFSFRGHLEFLGLIGAGTPGSLLKGLVLGIILAAGTILVFRWFGEIFLADQNIPGVLGRWGIDRTRMPLLFWFMVLVNGPAEELYWRGFVHSRMSGRMPRFRSVFLAAACYASYHGVTLFLLVANLQVAVLFMTAIGAAGIGWGWLREKTGSVWPALLGHAGAVIGYMVVARPLLGL